MSISDGIPMSVKNHEFIQNVTHPNVDACEVCMHERKYHASFPPITEAQAEDLQERFNTGSRMPMMILPESPPAVQINMTTIDALKIEPGGMYCIELPADTPAELAGAIHTEFERATGAKCLVLIGAVLSRNNPPKPEIDVQAAIGNAEDEGE